MGEINDKAPFEHVEIHEDKKNVTTTDQKTADAVETAFNEGTSGQLEIRKTLRKIDIRIIPMVTVLYLLSWLDRGNLGNAKVLGMVSSLPRL